MGCTASKSMKRSKSLPQSQQDGQVSINFTSQKEIPFTIKKNPIFQRRASQKNEPSPLAVSFIQRNK